MRAFYARKRNQVNHVNKSLANALYPVNLTLVKRERCHSFPPFHATGLLLVLTSSRGGVRFCGTIPQIPYLPYCFGGRVNIYYGDSGRFDKKRKLAYYLRYRRLAAA